MRSYDLGVNAYVVKPVDFQDFVDAVKALGGFWAVVNEPPPARAGGVTDAPALRVLHLEDDPHDRELVAATLRQDGLACAMYAVSTREAFEAALEASVFDVILADDRLPRSTVCRRSRSRRSGRRTLPFIFVSGTLGEEIAVERLKNGAVDYVLKQRLSRLPGSIARAIAEARMRAEHARAEVEVRRLNAELEQRVLERTAAARRSQPVAGRARTGAAAL